MGIAKVHDSTVFLLIFIQIVLLCCCLYVIKKYCSWPLRLVRMIGACLKGSAGENQRENSGGKSFESAPASPMPSFQQVPAMYSPYAMPHCLPFSMYHQPYLMPAMYPTMGYATPMSSPIYPQQMGSNFPVPSPQVEPFAHCFNPEDDNPRKPLLNPEDV